MSIIRADQFETVDGTGTGVITFEYGPGLVIRNNNTEVRDGNFVYRLDSSIPLPYTTTGAGLPEGGAFVSVGDAVLRQELGGGVRRVSSLAGLRDITGRSEGDAVYLTGRATDGDGGQGVFRWDASDLSPEVSGDPLEGIYVPPVEDSSGASGAWVRVFQKEEVDIRYYGAVEGRGTDNTAPIQAAINSGKPAVYIPPGWWDFTSLTIGEDAFNKGDILVYGEGFSSAISGDNRSTVLRTTLNVNGSTAIECSGAPTFLKLGFAAANGTFDPEQVALTGTEVNLIGVGFGVGYLSVIMDSCEMSGFKSVLRWGNGSGGYYSKIRHCSVFRCKAVARADDSFLAYNLTISDTKMLSVETVFDGSGKFRATRMTGSSVENYNMIERNACDGIHISNCYFETRSPNARYEGAIIPQAGGRITLTQNYIDMSSHPKFVNIGNYAGTSLYSAGNLIRGRGGSVNGAYADLGGNGLPRGNVYMAGDCFSSDQDSNSRYILSFNDILSGDYIKHPTTPTGHDNASYSGVTFRGEPKAIYSSFDADPSSSVLLNTKKPAGVKAYVAATVVVDSPDLKVSQDIGNGTLITLASGVTGDTTSVHTPIVEGSPITITNNGSGAVKVKVFWYT